MTHSPSSSKSPSLTTDASSSNSPSSSTESNTSSWLGFWKSAPPPPPPPPPPQPSSSNDADNTTEPHPLPLAQDAQEQKDDSDRSPQQQASSNGEPGLWSWLGYSSTPPIKTDPHPSLDKPTNTTKTESSSSSAPPVPKRPPSWHSYFFQTHNSSTTTLEKDSVIVEPTLKSQDELLKTAAAAPPPPVNNSPSTNIVLPSIQSQFSAPPQTFFGRAIHAIHSMFTLPDIIQQMKTHPDTVAGKKFVVIGIHGWFPTKLVRSVMGEPTGTSTKFCDQMTKAVQDYFEQRHGLTLPPDCVTQIPLQWEGKVQERVERLYAMLVEDPATLKAVQEADCIFWTTHSQGTPVSAILMDRLIRDGILQLQRQHVCFLAMAGIAHGPFTSLKGNLIVKYFEADAARELFDFMDPTSEISQAFHQSMASILQHGIKTVLIGSMEDQVVPLYSAIMVATDHPNILRALYIDGHIYSRDDFLINLVVFALKLCNAGLSDHGLLWHLSDVLAGNLYAWEGGHSTIYEEPSVYALAPQYLFDTLPLGPLAPTHHHHPVEAKSTLFKPKARLNPYYLTWAMRGVFDDPRVINVFGDELNRLRTLFDQWQPKTARLREIKFRLEPIKARL